MSTAVDQVLGAEGAGAIIRNALTVFETGEETVGELLARLQRAAEAAERDLKRARELESDVIIATSRARQAEDERRQLRDDLRLALDRLSEIQPNGIGFEVRWKTGDYVVRRLYRRDVLITKDFKAAAAAVRAARRAPPENLLAMQRPAAPPTIIMAPAAGARGTPS